MSGRLGWPRAIPDLRQSEAAECGLACLAMVASYHGQLVDLASLRRRHPVSLKGITLVGMIEVADRMGLAGRPLRLEPESLDKLALPAVLHWDMNHFVVLKRVMRRGRIVIQDPARGERRIEPAEVSRRFTGVALELAPMPGFERGRQVAKQRLADLTGPARGLVSPLIQTLVLSAILQAYVLAGPFYMQLAVDEGVVKDDRGLLGVLAFGFGLAMLFNAAAGWLRARILVYLQSRIAFDIGSGLFHHLLRLPLVFFERRHVGDLVSRFASVEPIRNLLAEGLISTIIDGAMALLTAAMVFLYSAELGLVVLGAVTAFALLRLGFYRVFRYRALDLVHARALENTAFIETVRAIQSLKIFNRESGRRALWSNRYADMTVANARVERLKASFRVLNDIVFGCENLAVIYLGALAVLDQRMTIGMLFAFVAYKQQFVEKAVRLVEKGIEFRMLDLHLDRLADISQTEPEPGQGRTSYRAPPPGRVEVRDLAFRYGPSEPPVFERVNFRIEPGEYVAITGPSGGGKTTLLKVMLGLLEPTQGEVRIDGLPLATYGARAFREHVGVVMQDDHLLSGSIADNICFFDEGFDYERMVDCAKFACVHDDITRMPMSYDSLIGDMGSSLSGGQRQRVLLARALYRRPRLLFMDEGTSHLDTEVEARVNAAISALGLTRIIIAHRPETIASAERRFEMAGGRVREVCRDGSESQQDVISDVAYLTGPEAVAA
ncbi:MAG: peptidase domain-containing ABC transporter [Acetobacteraceae bacterium]|nr:peptidase domain-containing ABC transporter [Acetobacteraceae bacterium]MBV8524005.1 peptidase domain-containing ABC transporter [Acetobacteraceae bacterium]